MSQSSSYFKVLGERNCGTNFLEQLCKQNLSLEILRGNPHRRVPLKRFEVSHDLYFSWTQKWNLGWKHAMAPPKELVLEHPKYEHLGICVMIKNPYSFLLSLFRRPYQYIGKAPESFHDFLMAPWKTNKRERWPKGFFESPIDLWNQKSRSYIDFCKGLPEHSMLIKYEQLVKNPEEVVDSLAQLLGQELKDFQNISESTKGEKGKDFGSYKEYYLEEKWREKLDGESISFINSQLDKELTTELGYKVL